MQYNKISGKIYEGRNQAELSTKKKIEGFKSDAWLTFLQANESGLRIKKGSKGVHVFKGFGTFDIKSKDGKYKTESRPLGFHTVFNMDQTEKAEKAEKVEKHLTE
jgi:antirestriction protein ArdC